MIKPKPAWAANNSRPRCILFAPWLALSIHCGQQRIEPDKRSIKIVP